MWQTKPVVLATQEFLLLQIVLFLLEKEKTGVYKYRNQDNGLDNTNIILIIVGYKINWT
jgi:hypothetical protein